MTGLGYILPAALAVVIVCAAELTVGCPWTDAHANSVGRHCPVTTTARWPGCASMRWEARRRHRDR